MNVTYLPGATRAHVMLFVGQGGWRSWCGRMWFDAREYYRTHADAAATIPLRNTDDAAPQLPLCRECSRCVAELAAAVAALDVPRPSDAHQAART